MRFSSSRNISKCSFVTGDQQGWPQVTYTGTDGWKNQRRSKQNQEHKPVFALSLKNIMLMLWPPLAHICCAECKLNFCCMQSSLCDRIVVWCLWYVFLIISATSESVHPLWVNMKIRYNSFIRLCFPTRRKRSAKPALHIISVQDLSTKSWMLTNILCLDFQKHLRLASITPRGNKGEIRCIAVCLKLLTEERK